jgi:hypothetical protein
MPPLPVIADTYRVAVIWTGVGAVNPVNVMHFRDDTSTSTAHDLAAVINASFGSSCFNHLSTDQTSNLLKITPLDGTTSTTDHNIPSGEFHGDTSGPYTPALAQVIKLTTGLRGREHRGRVFLGPVAEAAANDGVINSGTGLTNQQTAWESAEAGLIAAGFHLVVASYKLASAADVTAVSVEQLCATQRRRQSRLR